MWCLIPIWAFGADDELCDELFNYIDLWAELYSAVKNNYPSLKNKSAHGSKAISKAIVLLDTLYVRTPSEWKAILLPMHPLYLWRYYEIFKAAKKATRKKLSQDDILDIKETISRLPQVVNVVIADSLITGGENKILPNSGSIEALPTFENKVNRYVGSDGVLQFSEILERFVGFSPFAQNELRICAVDVPDFLAFLRAIKDFMKKQSGSRKVIIDGYLTRSQNSNNELAKLDFDGKDFEIGEFIKNGRLEISIHGVEGPSKIKEALKKKPVHVTELLLWDIWNFSVKNGDEDKPFIVVMDEAQNLDHGEKSPSAKILTEGRKFGISGWYATQFMRPQLSDDEIQRLQQAGQKLYFCPPDDGVMTVAKSIDISSQGAKEWAESLKKLKKGECVTCGNMVRNSRWIRYNPRIIKVPGMNERN